MTLPVWAGTFAVFAVLMAADLALTRKAVGLRAAATSSALWIAAALAFGGALWLWRGPGGNLAVRGLRRVLPVTDDYAGHRFFVRLGRKTMATPLLVALVAIEVTDLVFALDSIPAVFGVTRDMFVVFTSNAFAVLGLRALRT